MMMFLSSLSPPPNSLASSATQHLPLSRRRGGGADVVAVAMDDSTVQAFTLNVSQ
jgi:hypothetical protein